LGVESPLGPAGGSFCAAGFSMGQPEKAFSFPGPWGGAKKKEKRGGGGEKLCGGEGGAPFALPRGAPPVCRPGKGPKRGGRKPGKGGRAGPFRNSRKKLGGVWGVASGGGGWAGGPQPRGARGAQERERAQGEKKPIFCGARGLGLWGSAKGGENPPGAAAPPGRCRGEKKVKKTWGGARPPSGARGTWGGGAFGAGAFAGGAPLARGPWGKKPVGKGGGGGRGGGGAKGAALAGGLPLFPRRWGAGWPGDAARKADRGGPIFLLFFCQN